MRTHQFFQRLGGNSGMNQKMVQPHGNPTTRNCRLLRGWFPEVVRHEQFPPVGGVKVVQLVALEKSGAISKQGNSERVPPSRAANLDRPLPTNDHSKLSCGACLAGIGAPVRPEGALSGHLSTTTTPTAAKPISRNEKGIAPCWLWPPARTQATIRTNDVA